METCKIHATISNKVRSSLLLKTDNELKRFRTFKSLHQTIYEADGCNQITFKENFTASPTRGQRALNYRSPTRMTHSKMESWMDNNCSAQTTPSIKLLKFPLPKNRHSAPDCNAISKQINNNQELITIIKNKINVTYEKKVSSNEASLQALEKLRAIANVGKVQRRLKKSKTCKESSKKLINLQPDNSINDKPFRSRGSDLTGLIENLTEDFIINLSNNISVEKKDKKTVESSKGYENYYMIIDIIPCDGY